MNSRRNQTPDPLDIRIPRGRRIPQTDERKLHKNLRTSRQVPVAEEEGYEISIAWIVAVVENYDLEEDMTW